MAPSWPSLLSRGISLYLVSIEVAMIEIECSKLERSVGHDIGFWLDKNMPNPPLPEEPRWQIGYSADGRIGIRFTNDEDATYFMLMWS